MALGHVCPPWRWDTCARRGAGERVFSTVLGHTRPPWCWVTCLHHGAGKRVSHVVLGNVCPTWRWETCVHRGAGKRASNAALGNMCPTWCWEACVHRGAGDRVPNMALGNTRLAILDLSNAGSQPMKSNRSSSWITHNGEIYNFRELRSELESIDFMFKSKTDTEVAMSSYDAWGCNSIRRFQGMFGFGIWDESKRRFFLARDPFGIKPLYYYQSDDIFIFASEIRAILATGIVPRKLSSSGLSSYLHYGSVESPLTIIEGIKSLNPGHYMTVDLKGDVEIRSEEVAYVNSIFSQESNSHPDNRDDAVKLLRQMLEDSISSHLVSDVPVGVFLSGGIDSSAIVAAMSEQASGPVEAVCVGISEDGMD